MTAEQLIDYLQQFDPKTRVVATTDEIEEPGDFIALDFVIQQFDEGKGAS